VKCSYNERRQHHAQWMHPAIVHRSLRVRSDKRESEIVAYIPNLIMCVQYTAAVAVIGGAYQGLGAKPSKERKRDGEEWKGRGRGKGEGS